MCFWLTLEVCCEGHFSNSFPVTLKTRLVVVLCEDATRTRELEHQLRGKPLPSPVSCAQRCPKFDDDYARCERIFWTQCENCIRTTAANSTDLEDIDLRIIFDYNRLLLEELIKAMFFRSYQDLVKAFPTEFKIGKRYVLTGSRWVEAPVPSENDPLGPNPPVDSDLRGLEWWLDQGMGGAVAAEIWNTVFGQNDPFLPLRLPQISVASAKKSPQRVPMAEDPVDISSDEDDVLNPNSHNFWSRY